MTFEEWIDTFMGEDEKIHFLDAGLMKGAWDAAIDEAVKVAVDWCGEDWPNVGNQLADKIKRLKE